jgi:bile acid:Na+ symporter, BASS family
MGQNGTGANIVERRQTTIARVTHFAHDRLIWLLVASYVVAAALPSFGMWIRNVSFGELHLFHGRTQVSLPTLLLALLLLNAGMNIRLVAARAWLRNGVALTSGVAGNFLIPLLYVLVVSQVMRAWHNPDETQNILLGLALVAAMPIAGSSTAWSQNANGDMTVSLGLVLLTTVLSPVTTPLVLRSVALVTNGDYSEDLTELATDGTDAFLTLFVLLPSLVGVVTRLLVGEQAINAAKPHLKLLNIGVLLLLNYVNAAVSLPTAFRQPDIDFLLVTLLIATALCVVSFGGGYLIAKTVSANREQEPALIFGLGMNNNGTGLVIAAASLTDHPLVMLPIIFYNLVQHLIAGAVDHLRYRTAERVTR